VRIPPGSTYVKCKRCSARIVWVTTPRGKRAACNGDGSSHFDTCGKHAAPKLPAGGDGAELAPLPPAATYTISTEVTSEGDDARTARMLAWDFNGLGPPCRYCGNRHGAALRCDGSPASLSSPIL